MIIHENTLISDALLQERFACNVSVCKGACCIEGDKGAPITEDEITIIENDLPAIYTELSDEHKSFIDANGFWERDTDGEAVTTCLPDGRCAFVHTRKNGTLSCAIENAYYNNKTTFIKPISCHLYPVRIKQFDSYTALNYHESNLCKAACARGQEENVKVYQFVENALRRRFGDAWYDALVEIDEGLDAN
ncbi:MAG: hypothetical protein ACI8ZN_001440 [Bacteroidia bacterium]|jgi:hypothetical protein